MADPSAIMKDKLRHAEARIARCEDRLETLERQRGTFLSPLRNMSGRNRELLLFLVLCAVIVVPMTRRVRNATAVA